MDRFNVGLVNRLGELVMETSCIMGMASTWRHCWCRTKSYGCCRRWTTWLSSLLLWLDGLGRFYFLCLFPFFPGTSLFSKVTCLGCVCGGQSSRHRRGVLTGAHRSWCSGRHLQ
eukprot:scaffold10731_cov56-Attheya_sp.AAC.1